MRWDKVARLCTDSTLIYGLWELHVGNESDLDKEFVFWLLSAGDNSFIMHYYY